MDGGRFILSSGDLSSRITPIHFSLVPAGFRELSPVVVLISIFFCRGLPTAPYGVPLCSSSAVLSHQGFWAFEIYR